MSPSRRAALALSAALAGALGCWRWTAPSDDQKRSALDAWCEAFRAADAAHGADPKGAYAAVADHFSSRWSELNITNAGLTGMAPGLRYPLALRFARNDHHLGGWECPSLDRLSLRLAALDPPTDPAGAVVIGVASDGTIAVDGAQFSLHDLVAGLPRLHEVNHIAVLYRVGWEGEPHRHAKQVLDALVQAGFVIELVPKPFARMPRLGPPGAP